MSEQESNGANLSKTWSDTFQSIAEGGLPQIVAGPAGKAISRLIGATVEIPAAWLEQKAQGIRDETEARSKMMQTLADKSAELGLSNPKLLERGLNSMLGRAYREQNNREAVAGKVIEQLKLDPPPLDSPGPSDDWLDVFERRAGEASTEEVREIWAKVLAGEIRKPGAISLATLHFISMIDQRLAAAIDKVFQWVIFGDSLPTEITDKIDLQSLLLIRDGGLVSTLDSDLTRLRTH